MYAGSYDSRSNELRLNLARRTWDYADGHLERYQEQDLQDIVITLPIGYGDTITASPTDYQLHFHGEIDPADDTKIKVNSGWVRWVTGILGAGETAVAGDDYPRDTPTEVWIEIVSALDNGPTVTAILENGIYPGFTDEDIGGGAIRSYFKIGEIDASGNWIQFYEGDINLGTMYQPEYDMAVCLAGDLTTINLLGCDSDLCAKVDGADNFFEGGIHAHHFTSGQLQKVGPFTVLKWGGTTHNIDQYVITGAVAEDDHFAMGRRSIQIDVTKGLCQKNEIPAEADLEVAYATVTNLIRWNGSACELIDIKFVGKSVANAGSFGVDIDVITYAEEGSNELLFANHSIKVLADNGANADITIAGSECP